MKVPRRFYLAAALAGTIVPWIFFAGFIGDNGVDEKWPIVNGQRSIVNEVRTRRQLDN